MDINKIINELRQQRDGIEEAIASLTRLAVGQKRRGRPPKWIGSATPVKAKRVFSAETRRKMSKAQKKRWAN